MNAILNEEYNKASKRYLDTLSYINELRRSLNQAEKNFIILENDLDEAYKNLYGNK